MLMRKPPQEPQNKLSLENKIKRIGSNKTGYRIILQVLLLDHHDNSLNEIKLFRGQTAQHL